MDIFLKIETTEENFKQICLKEEFIEILRLARINNCIRYHIKAKDDCKEKDTPIGTRQIINSFFYSCALLFEGFETLSKMSKNLKKYHAFKKCLSNLKKNPIVKDLNKTIFPLLRNKMVFHFDSIIFKNNIEEFPKKSIFAESHSGFRKDIYYSLADDLVFFSLLKNSSVESPELFPEVVENVAKIVEIFIDITDSILKQTLKDLGFELVINNKKETTV